MLERDRRIWRSFRGWIDNYALPGTIDDVLIASLVRGAARCGAARRRARSPCRIYRPYPHKDESSAHNALREPTRGR